VNTVEACYYNPDIARPWIKPAIEATVKLCNRRRQDVIWATAGPISSWFVAYRVSQHTDVPYVLDLRDPHGLNYYEWELLWPKWIRRKVKRNIHQSLEGAQGVVFLFDSVAECYYRAFPGALDPAKIHIIPNGFDGEIEKFLQPNGDKCNVLYTGTMGTYRYDTLLQSLVSLKQTELAKAERLRLNFVGDHMDDLARDVAALGLRDLVEITGPISQSELTRLHRKADAFLILGREQVRKGHELVAGAKLFDYIKTRRPIIGVLPRDETRRILRALDVSTVADVDSLTEIADLFRRIVDSWSEQNLASLAPNRAACEAYSAERQTEALVRALQGVSADQRFTPGLVKVPPSLERELVCV